MARTRLVVEFSVDNAAFADDPAGEPERIFRKVVELIGQGRTDGRVIDSNGNIVGHWELEGLR